MKRWHECEKRLKELKIRDRKALFKEFKTTKENWTNTTLDSLHEVVVYLKRQIDVAEQFGIRKQALNRSVYHYRQFMENHYGTSK